MGEGRRVGLVVGKEWLRHCDRLPTLPQERTSMTLSLIKSFGLFQKVELIEARKASRDELLQFHSSDYLNFCSKATKCDDLEKLEMENDFRGENLFGLAYDCPLVEDIEGLISWVAGASLAAAESLVSKKCIRAINWGGGWHHGHRDYASGFCYVNDIVLAINKLRKAFGKVLYIDLDVHHGDGVEEAFQNSTKVFTFSIHNGEPGFYPGTGAISDVGVGKGKYFTLNVPLKEGAHDDEYHKVFRSLVPKVLQKFEPGAIVVQCGADSLSRDPLGAFNLTSEGVGRCVKSLLGLGGNLPGLFLGGGGYDSVSAAKHWTYLTSIILEDDFEPDVDIPDDDSYFERYGPSFDLSVTRGNRRNRNGGTYLTTVIEKALDNLEKLTIA